MAARDLFMFQRNSEKLDIMACPLRRDRSVQAGKRRGLNPVIGGRLRATPRLHRCVRLYGLRCGNAMPISVPPWPARSWPNDTISTYRRRSCADGWSSTDSGNPNSAGRLVSIHAGPADPAWASWYRSTTPPTTGSRTALNRAPSSCSSTMPPAACWRCVWFRPRPPAPTWRPWRRSCRASTAPADDDSDRRSRAPPAP